MTFLWARDDVRHDDVKAVKGGRAGGSTPDEKAAAELLAGQRLGDAVVAGFESQADAETWIGEHWRRLAEHGVSSVELGSLDPGGDSVKIYSLPLEGSR